MALISIEQAINMRIIYNEPDLVKKNLELPGKDADKYYQNRLDHQTNT